MEIPLKRLYYLKPDTLSFPIYVVELKWARSLRKKAKTFETCDLEQIIERMHHST